MLVGIPFARVHFSALQSRSVTPVQLPPHSMITDFGSIDARSDEWARDRCPSGLVPTGVKSGLKITAASTVRGTAFVLIPSIPSWPRGVPPSTGPCGPR